MSLQLTPSRLQAFILGCLLSCAAFAPGQERDVAPIAVDGTTGTPLGGFGAGAVKFNANDGTFSAMVRPPADAYDFRLLRSARFQLFVERAGQIEVVDPVKARSVNGRTDDDAIWPLHRVNCGTTLGVDVRMTAFSPLDRENPTRMSLPYAFYHLTLQNLDDSPATAACALQLDVGSDPVTEISGKGFAAKSWAVCAASEAGDDVLSVGGGDGFFRDGVCTASRGPLNRVAVKIPLKAKETKSIRFVLAWCDLTDPERCFYMNRYTTPGPIAELGLDDFDELQRNAETLVDRMRASDFPRWLQNQTLNTLANLSTNSMYKKDGRVAFAEGEWTCFGTMDQMWHARQIIGQLIPFFAWEELRYWARTQRKDGQIHHDFNYFDGGSDKATRSILVGWDDTEHKDYRNIDKWVDLNCGFIISVFETYQMTADRERFDELWPNVKRAAQRVLDQVQLYGSEEYPFTFEKSENSYDAGGDPNPFNASLSAVAYLLMADMAREQSELDLAEVYHNAYATVVRSFSDRYLKDELPPGKHIESYFGGQWLALHLELGEIWSAAEPDQVLATFDDRYHPYYLGLGHPEGTYDEWTPYLLTHYGGLLLNTRRAQQWRAMQFDAYTRQYMDRNQVFNHPLDILPKVDRPELVARSTHSDKQYISMPGLWRNYYDIIGYHRDLRTKELWLKPIVLDEMGGAMRNAMYVSPEGYGTIDCILSGDVGQNKEILFKPEKSIEVNGVHLADDFGEQVSVTLGGKMVPFKRSGTGYARELVVEWEGIVGPEGIRLHATGDPGPAPPELPDMPAADTPDNELVTSTKRSAFRPIQAESASKTAGTEIATIDGIRHVTSCHNFDFIHFSDVDFGTEGATSYSAKVRGLAEGATIDIVLDSVSGESIGACEISVTEGTTWEEVSCLVKKTTGIHDVILRFTGSSADNLLEIDSFEFQRDGKVGAAGQ